MIHSREQLLHLVPEFTALPAETEWLEFKVDNVEPDMVAERISALSNSARINGRDFGYLIWGVEDSSHKIVGTRFDPATAKKGNEPIEAWLARMINPQVHFEFEVVELRSTRLVVLTIEPASFEPVKFGSTAFVRVGSTTRELSRFPDRERRLWRAFDQRGWEGGTARERLSDETVLTLLDYPSYFQMLGSPPMLNKAGVLDALAADGLISSMPGAGWRISNLGGILLARRLSDFPSLVRKALRVIRYRGTDRFHAVKEQVGGKGYAAGFEGLVEYVNGLLPVHEEIGMALRTSNSPYPPIAIRELIANALIHQDFSISGAGPIVEVFDDRVEISNPGAPIVDPARLIDTAPRSRNEALASILRRMGVCEERGSGWDRVADQVERHHLPAPEVSITSDTTRVTLLSPRTLTEMTAGERAQAVYLHACLNQVARRHTTNSSVRERFGIEERNKATASRLLKDAVARELIAPYDATASPRQMRYVPFWAAREASTPS
ncbi:ATP-binding protein [Microbacterium sp. SORGH_AS_0969]|uniref:ATP-binding protein n=1 Tax=Microbacterium sp. SORGH_AS_0969 TaxID=3041793 RepID=UPI00278646A2|nr:ATP-binding protein [Microbacterium sp. SORGH_AS_0969]MDQ1074510.1 ATP-dependent DNA helicase RecG [Microbacterium sp. SORGH_AS_0969]